MTCLTYLRRGAFIIILTFAVLTQSALASPFAKLPKFDDADISPNGQRLAFVENIDGRYHVTIAETAESEARIPVYKFEERYAPLWIKWANDNRVLLAVRYIEIWKDQEFATHVLLSLDANSFTEEPVLAIKPLKRRQFNATVLNFLPDEPDRILMSVANLKMLKRPTYKIAMEVRKVNINNARYDIIQKPSLDVQDWYTDLEARIRIGQGIPVADRHSGNPQTRIRIFDLARNAWQDGTEFPNLPEDSEIFGFTENPDHVVIGRYNGRDTKGLYIYDIAQREWGRKLFHHYTYDVHSLIYSPDGKKVIGASYIGDSLVKVLFDDNGGRSGESFSSFLGQSRNAQYRLSKRSSPSNPGEFVLTDKSTGIETVVGRLYPDIAAGQLGKVISTTYPARDGESIPAFITLPRGVNSRAELKNSPFIVLPHGGPQSRDMRQFDYLAQSFAARGYGVLQMNFRGSTGYGKTFKEKGQKWSSMQLDVSDGARWLVDQGYSAPDRLCVGGWSFGGYAALMAKINDSELFACTFSIAGVTDIDELARHMRRFLYGKASVNKFLYPGFEDGKDRKRNSPVDRAADLTGPVFLAHGELDQRVNYEQFKSLRKALKKNKAVTLTAQGYPAENHFFSHEDARVDMMTGLHGFLDAALGDL